MTTTQNKPTRNNNKNQKAVDHDTQIIQSEVISGVMKSD